MRACFYLMLPGLFSSLGFAQVDLTPETVKFEGESGIIRSSVRFSDGASKINYIPPEGWIIRGEKDKAICVSGAARMEITAVNGDKWPDFRDEPGFYTAIATASVQGDATDIQVLSEPTRALLMDGVLAFEVTISYMRHNNTYKKSILFLNRDTVSYRFTVVAPSGTFDEMHGQARQSWFTWDWEDAQLTGEPG